MIHYRTQAYAFDVNKIKQQMSMSLHSSISPTYTYNLFKLKTHGLARVLHTLWFSMNQTCKSMTLFHAQNQKTLIHVHVFYI